MNVASTALTAYLGSVAVSALGLMSAINMAVLFLINSLAVGGTVAVARAYGRQDIPGVGTAAQQSIVSITLIGILMTVISWITRTPLIYALYGGADPEVLKATVVMYELFTLSVPMWAYISVVSGVLRGVGDTKTTMKVSILMSVANFVLTLLFIKGLHVEWAGLHINYEGLGIRGPGLGLFFARLLGVVAVTMPLLRGRGGNRHRSIRMRSFLKYRPDFSVLRAIYSIGIPASAEAAIFQIGKIVTQIIIVGLGTANLAANTVAWSILMVFNIPGGAANISATTLVGQTTGEGDKKKSRVILLTMIGLVSCIYVLMSLLLIVFMRPLIGTYAVDAEVYSIVRMILLSLLIPMTILWPGSFISASGLRAAGDVRFVMVVSVVSMWVLRVGGAFLFIKVFDFGIMGLWISMYMDWVVRIILFGSRIFGDKWFARSGIKPNRQNE